MMTEVSMNNVKNEVSVANGVINEQENLPNRKEEHDCEPYNSSYQYKSLNWDDDDAQDLNQNFIDEIVGDNAEKFCARETKLTPVRETVVVANFATPFSSGYGTHSRSDSNTSEVKIEGEQGREHDPEIGDYNDTDSFSGPDSCQQEQIRAEIMIRPDKVGLIIGRGGRTIKMLQEKTQTKMHIVQIKNYHKESPSNSMDKTLVIFGTQDSVLHAEQLVYDLISKAPATPKQSEMFSAQKNNTSNYKYNNNNFSTNNADALSPGSNKLQKFSASNTSSPTNVGSSTAPGSYNSLNRSNRVKTMRFPVPKIAVGLIIGKGGETIKRIRFDTGAKVQFNPLNTSAGETEEQMAIITGKNDQIRHACDMIEELIDTALNSGGPPAGPPMGRQVPIENPIIYSDSRWVAETHGHGQTLTSSPQNQNFGQMPSQNTSRSNKNQIQTQNQNKSTRHNSIASNTNPADIEEDSITVPADKLRLLTGKGRDSLYSINHASGAYCDIERNDESGSTTNNDADATVRMIHIRGYRHQIEHAKELILDAYNRRSPGFDRSAESTQTSRSRDPNVPNQSSQCQSIHHPSVNGVDTDNQNHFYNVGTGIPGNVEWGQGDQNTQWGHYSEPSYYEPPQPGHPDCYMHLPTNIAAGSDCSQWVQYFPPEAHPLYESPNPNQNQEIKSGPIPPIPIMSATIVQNPNQPANFMAPPAIYFSLPPIHSPNSTSNLPDRCNTTGAGAASSASDSNSTPPCNNLATETKSHEIGESSFHVPAENFDFNKCGGIATTIPNPDVYKELKENENDSILQEIANQIVQSTAGLDLEENALKFAPTDLPVCADVKSSEDHKPPQQSQKEAGATFDQSTAAGTEPFSVINPQIMPGFGNGGGATPNIGTPGSCTRIVSFYYDLNVNSIVIMNQWHYY